MEESFCPVERTKMSMELASQIRTCGGGHVCRHRSIAGPIKPGNIAKMCSWQTHYIKNDDEGVAGAQRREG